MSQATYIGFNQDKISILDVCICSPQLWNKIKDFTILSSENMGSDHLPLFACLSGLSITRTCASKTIKNKNELNFNYEKADWENYQRELETLVVNLPVTDDSNTLNKFFVDSVYSAAQKSIFFVA